MTPSSGTQRIDTSREAVEHDLKTWPVYFQPLVDGVKRFEIRLNDRGFQIGDVLRLREWELGTYRYTGRELRMRVVYMTGWEQKEGYVVMGVEPEPPREGA